ncbi:hypothetical protein PMAYCL1PPCAC_24790, partial [Pristionchus mayeri]
MKGVFYSNTDLLRMADKYNLHGLLEHCLSKLKTTKDFKEIQESSIFGDLSPETVRLLFTRHLN